MASTDQNKKKATLTTNLGHSQEKPSPGPRMNNSSSTKSIPAIMGGKSIGRYKTTPNNNNNGISNSSSKRVASIVLPDIPIVSNFDGWLTTFLGKLFPLADTNTGPQGTSHIMDPLVGKYDLGADSNDQEQNDEVLDHATEPTFDLPAIPDLRNSDTDDRMATNPEVSTISATNANTGFSFNTTIALPTSPIHTPNPNCKLLSKTRWLNRLRRSIHPSFSARTSNIGTWYNNMDKSGMVDQDRQQQHHGGDDSSKGDLWQSHHSFVDSAALPTADTLQENEYEQSNRYPFVSRHYRLSVYNAALCDLSPFMSPEGSVIHDSTLYRRCRLSPTFSDKMVTSIFQGQAMAPPSTDKLPLQMQMDPTPLDQESVLLEGYYGVNQAPTYIHLKDWNNSNKRVSKALLEDMEDHVRQDEKALLESPTLEPESHEQQMNPTGKSKQQRRLSQRLLDAFRLSANIQSTRATVVQPAMATSSISSSITQYSTSGKHYLHNSNSIDTAWNSWQSYTSLQHGQSNMHHLKSLRKSLEEIASLSCHAPKDQLQLQHQLGGSG